MAYYDRIARQWHTATGAEGGAFKQHVLNPRLLDLVGGIDGQAILELGAGNGYFLPLLLRRRSGQQPRRIVVTDISLKLLELAQRHFRVADAEYLRLDVRAPFPFEDGAFDLVLATMVFNEVTTAGLRRALRECRRVLRPGGRLIATVTHPDFVESLSRRGQLRSTRGIATMPGTGDLRLPVIPRPAELYARLLTESGFDVASEDLFADDQVLRAKPGLRHLRRTPIALLLACRRR